MGTIGNCQRPVFSVGVSHHKHKITSLWKFGLNRSSKLRENDERNNTLVRRFCVLLDRNNYFSEKLPLSQKLRFRGSRLPKCFILSTAIQCSLRSQFQVNICFEWLPNVCTFPLIEFQLKTKHLYKVRFFSLWHIIFCGIAKNCSRAGNLNGIIFTKISVWVQFKSLKCFKPLLFCNYFVSAGDGTDFFIPLIIPAMFGKFCITSSFSVAFLYGAEIFPTPVR